MLKKTIYKGTFIYCDSLEDLEISEHGNIGVDEQGTITFINHPIHELDAKWSDAHIIDINKNNTSECNFFFPGFIGAFFFYPLHLFSLLSTLPLQLFRFS